MHTATYAALCALIRDHTGMSLGESKRPMVEARVAGRADELGLVSEDAYLGVLQEQSSQELVWFIDSLTTNFTKFFRTPAHFARLEAFVKAARARGRARFRLWSCACATGEEAWTMAISMAEALGLGLDWRILATDISTRALELASAGLYPRAAYDALPSQAKRHFAPVGGGEQGFEIVPALRERVSFGRLDLAHPPFPMKGPFDVIFCRNVLMYLASEERRALVHHLERLLAPGGLLMVSPAEGLSMLGSGLERVDHSLYRRPERAQ